MCKPPAPKPSPRTPGAKVQRQGRSGGDARKAPAASPRLVQPAPSWAGSLSAMQAWARLAQSRASSCQQLCHIGPLSRAGALPYWRRTGAQPSRARAKRGWAASSSLEEARLPLLFTRLPGGGALRLLQVLAQGLLALSWGCGREPRHAGAGPNQLQTSLLERRALGNLRV